ncbi:MAG: hypothetical protein QM817_19745 [Archangium sp.]
MNRVIALFITAAASLAFADEPIAVEGEATDTEPESIEAQACRPTIACMAELVPAGTFEVEAGYGGRMSNGAFAHSGQLLLKYSVLDHLQLQLATNNVFLAGAGLAPRAFDGVMPGLKWKVNDQGTFMPSNALSAHLMMPTHGFADASQKTFDLQAWWYVSKDVGIVHADFNLMFTLYDLGSGKPIPQGLSTLAVSADLSHGFGVFTEVYSTWGNAQAIPLDGGSLNGISFSPVDEVVFDLGGDIGFFPGTRAFTVFAGVTFVPHRRSKVQLVRRPTAVPGAVAMGGAR